MIRKADGQDFERVWRLMEPDLPYDAEESEEYLEQLAEEGLLLVEDRDGDGTLIGVCYGLFDEEEGWAEIQGVHVAPEVKGRGVALALLQSFEELLPPTVTHIHASVPLDSKHLFTELGFSQEETFVTMRKER